MRVFVSLIFMMSAAMADPILIDDFSDGDPDGWRYVSDRVMGGVSTGQSQLMQEGGTVFVRLEGEVSTQNNGGFIQVRRELADPFPNNATGLKLRVRGNGAVYYVHLRPKETRRPWHFFQAKFPTTGDWQTVTLPWSSFTAQGGLNAPFVPAHIQSIGVVAYGADYTAKLDLDRVSVE